MTDKRINDYLENGGKLFTVTDFDIIRDGGTKFIKTSKGCFYIDKVTKEIFSKYPLTEENRITSKLFREYLVLRIIEYLDTKEKDIITAKKFMVSL